MKIEYNASKICSAFHRDGESSVKALMGPIGSGKSVACCWEVFAKCQTQSPGNDGIRRSRWAVIRNTYRELHDTTIKTFHDWFPENMGKWKISDSTQTWEFGDVHAEIMFRALDRPDDVKKLLSLELTGAFVNEAREIPWAVIKMLRGRIGRYPSKRDGGPSWYGLIMDTNPPDEDHWWYKRFEEMQPKGWKLYRQPSALSPEAENLENLPPDYYEIMTQGTDPEWQQVYVHGEYGIIMDGKPVYPAYVDSVHCLQESYKPERSIPITLGIDFGRTPACAFIQYHKGIGRYIAFDEFLSEDMGADRFAPELKHYLDANYAGFKFNTAYGDPSGGAGNQSTDKTPFQILRKFGIPAIPTKTNDPLIRRSAIGNPMRRLCMDGKPAFMIDKKCRMWRKGLMGGFQYKRVQVSGDERFQDKPDKNKFSHICEAGEYALQGSGEGVAAISRMNVRKPKVIRTIRPHKRSFA